MIKVDIPYRTPPEVMEQLWKDGEYVRFFALRDAVRRYRDLKVYQYNGKTFLASVHVNVMAATTKVISFLNDYPVPEVAPAWLWVSYRDPKINQVISKVKVRLNPGIKIGGVIATMYDARKVLNRDVVETIKKYFGELVFKTMIRDNVALAEAPSQRKDIFAYSPQSPGAEDYLELCKEIIERTGNLELSEKQSAKA